MVSEAKPGNQEFKSFLESHQAVTIKGSCQADPSHAPAIDSSVICQLTANIAWQNKVAERQIELKQEDLDLREIAGR